MPATERQLLPNLKRPRAYRDGNDAVCAGNPGAWLLPSSCSQPGRVRDSATGNDRHDRLCHRTKQAVVGLVVSMFGRGQTSGLVLFRASRACNGRAPCCVALSMSLTVRCAGTEMPTWPPSFVHDPCSTPGSGSHAAATDSFAAADPTRREEGRSECHGAASNGEAKGLGARGYPD